jgi:ceramide glucosyltransferase
MQHEVALGLLAIGITSLLFSFVMHGCLRVVLRRARGTKDVGPTPPVSILKPLKGADPELYENLASLARQDYPEFEIVFGTEDTLDPALAVARRIKRDFPHVRVSIVAGGRSIGHNPKVNNLAQLSRVARHDWTLVSDADVRVDPLYLRAMTAETVDPRVGLVSSVIANVGEKSLGATFDNLHMNGFVAGVIAAADVLAGHSCVVGKSMLVRRSDLGRLGGLEVVKDVLAEDYVLGQLYQRAGFKVALSGHPVRAMCHTRTFESFFGRHVRWGQMRRHIAPLHHLGEPLLLPTPWLAGAAFWSLTLGHAAGKREALVLLVSLVGMAARCVSDALQTRALRGTAPSLIDLPLIPIKDLVITTSWALSTIKRTVQWRGNSMRIGRGSVLTAAVADSRGRAENAAH